MRWQAASPRDTDINGAGKGKRAAKKRGAAEGDFGGSCQGK
jgi:hypothetical protein